jgi:hypothetical protein
VPLLQALGWKVFPPVDPWEFSVWKYGESERFLIAFAPNGGMELAEGEPDE